MIKITTVASSSAGNMYLLDNGQSRLMVECGIPWAKAVAALNYNLSGISGILLSHEHGDHSKGIRHAKGSGIDIYLSKGTAEVMDLSGHRIHVMMPQVYRNIDGGWAVYPFPVRHDAAEPFGFVVDSGADRLLFLTDTFYNSLLIPGVTHLITECNFSKEIISQRLAAGQIAAELYSRVRRSHMSLEKVLEMIRANEWNILQEIHLIHLSDGNSDEALFKTEVQKLTGVPVYVAGR
jgi:phosphoribosyl 1,2-cyclic phosphodiesterase